jgi:peptide chain release factor subunit 1
MFGDINLRELAEIHTPDRSFLSVYLSGPGSISNMEKSFTQLRRVLKDEKDESDEKLQFDENVKTVKEYLLHSPLKSGSLCIFSAWIINYFKVFPLQVSVPDNVLIDSSPYIRPLAELQDEYENVAVVIADAKKARIFLVSSAVPTSEETIKGNIKNHVRKGGWSQQRYERRRDKQLLLYAREIIDALLDLEKKEDFRRILLVGAKETVKTIYDNVSQQLLSKITSRGMDLSKGEDILHKDIMELFVEQERKSELELWEKIRKEYLKGGLGIVGLNDVFLAAREGRIEELIVERDYHPEGMRCRDCENLIPAVVNNCPACNSTSLFKVDTVNEIVELLKRSGASVDFADNIHGLSQAGRIAAFLRYSYH